MLKPTVFLMFLMLGAATLHAQQNFDAVKLAKPSDYAAAESQALQASSYLLTSRLDKNDTRRLNAMKFLIRWMEGTPDYTFSLDEHVAKITGDDVDLMGIYMASMVKFCLENKQECRNPKAVQLNAVKSLLAYCSDSNHGVKLKGELKKLKDADEKGKLDAYISE